MYEELISELREEAEWAKANEWETPIMLSDHLTQAADAIEEMQAGEKKFLRNISALEMENENLKRARRWIPVTERLPEDTHPVLVTYLGYNDKLPKSDMVAICDDGDWYWYDEETKCKVAITHWMPLPQPPKEET